MEVVPQKDYCPVEPTNKGEPAHEQAPVSPPSQPEAQAKIQTEPSAKPSTILIIILMLLLTVSSGLGYLIFTGNTAILQSLLP